MNKYFYLLILFFSFSIFSKEKNNYTISGISSGGFMASQMATIYSSSFNGVGTVAGGFYYCAKDYLPRKIKEDKNTLGMTDLFLFEPTDKFYSETLNPFIIFHGANPATWFRPSKGNPIYQAVSICMGDPEKANFPTDYIKQNEEKNFIDPISNLKKQKVFIYHGLNDSVLNFKMKDRLREFYLANGVSEENIEVETSNGNHNFPTDRIDGIRCDEERVPYISSCSLNIAGNILQFLINDQLIKSEANKDHIYLVDQNQNRNINKKESEWTSPIPSVAPYGYLYSSDKCLNQPKTCKLHIALHGCKMTDSYQEAFQTLYQIQVNAFWVLTMKSKNEPSGIYPNLPVIENKNNQFGLLKFVLDSGYLEYAEKNDLMILFPQTWITKNNYPYNPKGCWDWFGYTGKEYATNKGAETSWMMDFIESIANNPKNKILPIRPHFEVVEKNFPRN